MKRLLLSIATLLTIILPATAQNDQCVDSLTEETIRSVMSAYMLELGSSHLVDTYLSPLKFNGAHYGLRYERMQAMKFDPHNWVMRMNFGININRASSTRNDLLWDAGLDYSWAMMRRWKVYDGVQLAIGPQAALDAGVVYNPRNGNNPASAKGAITIGVTGYAAWNFKIKQLPITLRYQPSLPIIGAFFAPDFGELYYEIYKGNHSGLAHCAWWGNYLQSSHLLTADLHFGGTSLRVGYHGDFLSTKINHTVTHIFSHAFIIGVSGEWMSLNPRKAISRKAQVISALF